jgi:hypothetical protein
VKLLLAWAQEGKREAWWVEERLAVRYQQRAQELSEAMERHR